MNPFFLTSVRLLIAAMVGIVLVSKYSSTEIFKNKVIWILSGLNALGFLFQHIGMQFALASESALLVNVNIILVAILASYFLSERMTSQEVLALSLGVCGILILTTKGACLSSNLKSYGAISSFSPQAFHGPCR